LKARDLIFFLFSNTRSAFSHPCLFSFFYSDHHSLLKKKKSESGKDNEGTPGGHGSWQVACALSKGTYFFSFSRHLYVISDSHAGKQLKRILREVKSLATCEPVHCFFALILALTLLNPRKYSLCVIAC
jgi:hypothetical protein